jgi:S1-C subfamily serine protease
MSKQLLPCVIYFVAPWIFSPGFTAAQIDVDVVSESIVHVRAYHKDQVAVEGVGFVVNEMGYVLTNAHLVEKAERVTVLSLKRAPR